MKRILLLLYFLCWSVISFTQQQTVGLFFNEDDSYNGYTLFNAANSRTTYLIDNCGNVVNEWSSEYSVALSTYLLENGNLLRPARVQGSFNAGGSGGRVEIFNWEGELLWGHDFATENYHSHHDVEPLPNGNFLLLAWEQKTVEEAEQAGRIPTLISTSGVWPEQIWEVKPNFETGTYDVVWEWHLWDHLIQDFSGAVDNFGIVSDHPELVDINYNASNSPGGGGADWIHANSIDYNPELDQIILNSRNFDEFWIIDHSTTTEEAASHSGGNAGKGGDILYRWGNPQTYKRGGNFDQVLFVQHDANWVPAGYPDAGKIMVYNNGLGRPDGNYSTVDLIDPPMDDDGNYSIADDKAYGPTELSWQYQADPVESFFSERISGASQLPNGNVLICEGRGGRFFEVNQAGEILWLYRNPSTSNGAIMQGDPVQQNDVFRVTRYGTDYPAFDGRSLSPMDPIELNPYPSDCEILPTSIPISWENLEDIRILKNPIESNLIIENLSNSEIQLQVLDLSGKIIVNHTYSKSLISIPSQDWASGMYIVHFIDHKKHQISTQKVVKL